MKTESIVARLRIFLLGLAAFMFAGTPVELFLQDHYREKLQLVPFVLCGLGLLTALVALLRANHNTILATRIVMILIALGGAGGTVIHLYENFELELEMRPGVGPTSVIMEALKGAAPLLAPGILTLAALIALVATYYHPALGKTASTGDTR